MSGETTVTSFRRHVRAQILNELRESGESTRAELMERLGLSRTALTRILTGLFDEGHVLEEPVSAQPGRAAGRPARLLRVRTPPRNTLALHVASDSVTTALVDQDGQVRRQTLHPIPLEAGFDAVVDLLRDSVSAVGEIDRATRARQSPGRAVVVLPTMIRADGLGVDVDGARDLMGTWTRASAMARLRQVAGMPVVLQNDARMAALAESRVGAACGARDVLYVSPGANGIGGGLVLGGRLHVGAGLAGEISHVVVRPGGQLCPCGQRGCLATEVRHQVRRLRAQNGAADTDRDGIGLPDTADGYGATLDDLTRLIAQAAGGIVSMTHPAVVVIEDRLSGGRRGDLAARISADMTAFVHPAILRSVTVRPALLGSTAALVGAGLVD